MSLKERLLHIYISVKICKYAMLYSIRRTSLVAQMVKNLPAMWETQVQSLCQENSLQKEMATHSSILT